MKSRPLKFLLACPSPSPHSNQQRLRSVEQPREEAAVRSLRGSVGRFQRPRTVRPRSPWLLSNLPPRFRGGHFPRGALQHFLRRKVSYRWVFMHQREQHSRLFCITVGIKWLLRCVCVQETSMSTPTREPPTLSSTSLVVGAPMRGARRWWRKTGVRSASHKVPQRVEVPIPLPNPESENRRRLTRLLRLMFSRHFWGKSKYLYSFGRVRSASKTRERGAGRGSAPRRSLRAL